MTPKELELITAVVDAAIAVNWFPYLVGRDDGSYENVKTTPEVTQSSHRLGPEFHISFMRMQARTGHIYVCLGHPDIVTDYTQTPVFYEAVSNAIRKVNELCR